MKLLHELPLRSAERSPDGVALLKGSELIRYGDLASLIARAAGGFTELGVARGDRVAVYLPKQFETVVSIFGALHAGAVFVPINPVLKAGQVGHILRDSEARVLVTSAARLEGLRGELEACPGLICVVVDDDAQGAVTWRDVLAAPALQAPRLLDIDLASILYTSGSTGKPKGVVLSHRNMTCGAESVAEYLGNTADDRLLAVLPFSFDYGFSQLSTAFLVGAAVALMDYLVPRDIVKAVTRYDITGLAAVPPIWIQLADLEWAAPHLRYITNSGGAMPTEILAKLRAKLPRTQVYLMYGLTEAFRSTYLPPDQVDKRPTSIGKAIPNAEVLVVRPDGTECAPGEPGELVHRGALVSLGYWKDPHRTAERFRPAPTAGGALPVPEIAVWSGDTVVRDEEGYLYFVGRNDDMIKTSGYRVSPTEIEEVVYSTGLVAEAAAVGAPHPVLGKAIVLFAVAAESAECDADALLAECRRELPTYMVPAHVEWREALPRNPNGKIDRRLLADECGALFGEAEQ